VLALSAADLLLSISQALYIASPAFIAGSAIAFLAAAVLFFWVGREVKRRWTRLLALVGIAVASVVLITAIEAAAWGSRLATTRAARIAEANGFRVLLPAWLPAMHDVEGLINVPPGDATIGLETVDALPKPDAGVSLSYNGGAFVINERKTGTGLSLTQLESTLPTDAVRTQVTIRGHPALLVEYKDEAASTLPSGLVRKLFLEADGVSVDMSGLSQEQLVKVAESLTAR